MLTGFNTLIARRTAPCSTMPAHSIRNRKGAALPSMIGTSDPSSSTIALSISAPASAAITCSTVPILIPSPSHSTVQRGDSIVLAQFARISAVESVRRNTIPVSGGAGCKVIATLWPE